MVVHSRLAQRRLSPFKFRIDLSARLINQKLHHFEMAMQGREAQQRPSWVRFRPDVGAHFLEHIQIVIRCGIIPAPCHVEIATLFRNCCII